MTAVVFAIATTIVTAITLTAQAASFACEKATSPVERAVCSSTETSDLDEVLGRYYAAARMALKSAESCLVNDQRVWLRTVRDACRDTGCLKRTYLERLAVLDALQPGVTRLRTIELPKVPPLVWIVAPAADQVAAPRNRSTTPLQVSGRIVDEVTTGDGYVLQTSAGAKHLIVMQMFLEQPTQDALAALARTPNARYEVRGRADVEESGVKSFSPAQCTLVYRIAP